MQRKNTFNNSNKLKEKYDKYLTHKKNYAEKLHKTTIYTIKKIKNILNNDVNLQKIKIKVVGSIGNGTIVTDTNEEYDLDLILIKESDIDDEKVLIKEGIKILNKISQQLGNLFESQNKRTITFKNIKEDIKIDLALVFLKDKQFYNAKYFNSKNQQLTIFNPDYGIYNKSTKELTSKIKSKQIIATYNDAVRFAKYLNYFYQINFGSTKEELYKKVKDSFIINQNSLKLENKKLGASVKKSNSIIIIQSIIHTEKNKYNESISKPSQISNKL